MIEQALGELFAFVLYSVSSFQNIFLGLQSYSVIKYSLEKLNITGAFPIKGDFFILLGIRVTILWIQLTREL